MRGISPSPPKLGELTGLFPGVLTKVDSTERNFALSISGEIRTAFTRVRQGFGVREAVPLAVGSLSYRRVICRPVAFGGSAGLWCAVLAMTK